MIDNIVLLPLVSSNSVVLTSMTSLMIVMNSFSMAILNCYDDHFDVKMDMFNCDDGGGTLLCVGSHVCL